MSLSLLFEPSSFLVSFCIIFDIIRIGAYLAIHIGSFKTLGYKTDDNTSGFDYFDYDLKLLGVHGVYLLFQWLVLLVYF